MVDTAEERKRMKALRGRGMWLAEALRLCDLRVLLAGIGRIEAGLGWEVEVAAAAGAGLEAGAGGDTCVGEADATPPAG